MESRGEAEGDFSERLRRWMAFVRTILPGGSWWSFSEDVEVRILAEPVTVSRALVRMWKLVANDRWVIFAAFSTLIVAAVSFKHVVSLSIIEVFFIIYFLDSISGTAFRDFNTAFLDGVNLHRTERRNRGVPPECEPHGSVMYCSGNLQVKILYGQKFPSSFNLNICCIQNHPMLLIFPQS